jgi:CheY-specific phosphatase CheX
MRDQTEVFFETLAETLEQFAFLFAEPARHVPLPPQPTQYLYAFVNMSGGVQGTLFVCADPDLCREMAANVLGEETEDMSAACAEDALKELTNIVAGGFAARRFAPERECDLSAPQVTLVDRGKALELSSDSSSVRVLIDDRMLVAGVLLAEGAEQ